MNETQTAVGILATFALLVSCGGEERAADLPNDMGRVGDIVMIGDASITQPCADAPATSESVSEGALARFEAALGADFSASGSWVMSADGPVQWSHAQLDSSAVLEIRLDPVSAEGWTWFASDTEECALHLGQSVVVTAATEDGGLTDQFNGRLTEDETGILHLNAQFPLASLSGSLRGATVEPPGAMRVVARFDLTLTATSFTGTLTGFAEYPEADGQAVRVLSFQMGNW